MKEQILTLFKQFKQDHYKSSYSQRDNCGIAAIDLIEFLRENKIKATRIKGTFLCDIPVHNKKDFTMEMKKEFFKSELDFNQAEDRLKWLLNSPYSQEWCHCPHYWVEVQGIILDPSGEGQFLETGLAKDLSEKRYKKESED